MTDDFSQILKGLITRVQKLYTPSMREHFYMQIKLLTRKRKREQLRSQAWIRPPKRQSIPQKTIDLNQETDAHYETCSPHD